MMVALASAMPPPTPWRLLSLPRITPTTRRCIIYEANLSAKDRRQSDGREERGKKWIIWKEKERGKKQIWGADTRSERGLIPDDDTLSIWCSH